MTALWFVLGVTCGLGAALVFVGLARTSLRADAVSKEAFLEMENARLTARVTELEQQQGGTVNS